MPPGRRADLREYAQSSEVRRTTGFVLRAGDEEFQAPALVIATGGLSIPKMGATSFGYDVARQFGLAIRECRPALVPLTLGDEDRERYCDLAGVSAEVIASAGKQRFREKMLITHRGLSGPAILQISSYWQPARADRIDLSPGRDVSPSFAAARHGGRAIRVCAAVLPQRLADRWMRVPSAARLDDRARRRSSTGRCITGS